MLSFDPTAHSLEWAKKSSYGTSQRCNAGRALQRAFPAIVSTLPSPDRRRTIRPWMASCPAGACPIAASATGLLQVEPRPGWPLTAAPSPSTVVSTPRGQQRSYKHFRLRLGKHALGDPGVDHCAETGRRQSISLRLRLHPGRYGLHVRHCRHEERVPRPKLLNTMFP